MLECVINISEGRDAALIDLVAGAAGNRLLDRHSDPHHHRSVLTVVGEEPARAVTREAVARIDLTSHTGVHPRIGAVDVVPFVPLGADGMAEALTARDSFARWAATAVELPCFLYGPERTLPEVRRGAFSSFPPDEGPSTPHPTAGGCAVGARSLLVAYNLWLAEADLDTARRVAAGLRGPTVRALGLAVGDRVQVSMNLVAPMEQGPADVHNRVAGQVGVAGAELVGLVPAAVLAGIPRHRWAELDVSEERTIEARLERAGLSPA